MKSIVSSRVWARFPAILGTLRRAGRCSLRELLLEEDALTGDSRRRQPPRRRPGPGRPAPSSQALRDRSGHGRPPARTRSRPRAARKSSGQWSVHRPSPVHRSLVDPHVQHGVPPAERLRLRSATGQPRRPPAVVGTDGCPAWSEAPARASGARGSRSRSGSRRPSRRAGCRGRGCRPGPSACGRGAAGSTS